MPDKILTIAGIGKNENGTAEIGEQFGIKFGISHHITGKNG